MNTIEFNGQSYPAFSNVEEVFVNILRARTLPTGSILFITDEDVTTNGKTGEPISSLVVNRNHLVSQLKGKGFDSDEASDIIDTMCRKRLSIPVELKISSQKAGETYYYIKDEALEEYVPENDFNKVELVEIDELPNNVLTIVLEARKADRIASRADSKAKLEAEQKAKGLSLKEERAIRKAKRLADLEKAKKEAEINTGSK